MKKTLAMLIIGAATAALAAEPTLDDVQKELTLTKAKLQLVEIKLALAAKEKELEKLADASGEKKDKKADEKKEAPEKKLWLHGVERLEGLDAMQRDHLLGANGISPLAWPVQRVIPIKKVNLAGDPTAIEEVKPYIHVTQEEKEPANEFERRQKDAKQIERSLPKLQKFLVAYAYDAEKKAAALAKKEVDDEVTEAADQFGQTAIVDIKTKTVDEVLMRNAGLSFSQGFGVAFGSGDEDDASIGTLMARWNWLQRSAAGKWNRWVGQNNAEGYAQVPYRGKIEYWLGRKDYTDSMPTERRNRTWPEFTAFGPCFGTGAVGEKTKFGTDEERPYLVGLTFGFGFLDEAASLVYVDVGATVSPNSGFAHSKAFAGFSMDAIILSKVLGLTRKAKPESN